MDGVASKFTLSYSRLWCYSTKAASTSVAFLLIIFYTKFIFYLLCALMLLKVLHLNHVQKRELLLFEHFFDIFNLPQKNYSFYL